MAMSSSEYKRLRLMVNGGRETDKNMEESVKMD